MFYALILILNARNKLLALLADSVRIKLLGLLTGIKQKSLYIRCIYIVNMATELVTFKMEHDFLKDVDKTAKRAGFQNRTEFIRAALRDKIDETKMKEAMMSIAHLKGAAKKKISSRKYEKVREKAFEEFDKKQSRLNSFS